VESGFGALHGIDTGGTPEHSNAFHSEPFTHRSVTAANRGGRIVRVFDGTPLVRLFGSGFQNVRLTTKLIIKRAKILHMGAVSALTTAAGTLRKNPVIFAGVFILSAVGSLTTIGQVSGTLIALVGVLATLLVSPFVRAGVLGMAEEATAEKTSLSTLLSEGRASYLSLLGATVLQAILFGLVGAIWAVGVIAALIGGGGGPGSIAAAIGLSVLVFFVPIYLLQFYDVAIVVSDTSAWGGFKRSFGFVRSHLLSALGYTIIAQTINLLVFVPTFWLVYGAPLSLAEAQSAAEQLGGASGPETLVPLVAISLIAGTIVSSLLITYRVTYYTNLATERTNRTTIDTAG